MSRLVLDAGALVALDRNDRFLWRVLKTFAADESEVLVPSTALAQAWRGIPSQARLARALSLCVIAPFDPLARAVGELCGRTRTRDVCDAHVALVATQDDAVVCTSDPADIERLASACRGRQPVIFRC